MFPYQRIWIFAIVLSQSVAAEMEPLVVLQEECFRCHNQEKRKGGLIMTSREALLKGGDSDAALLPGNREQSYLYELLAEDADPHMPPKKQLSAAEVEAIGRWIDEGAKWDASVLKSERREPGEIRLGALPKRYRPVLDLAVSPDERLLAAARGDAIEVFDLSSEEPQRVVTLLGHRDAVQSLAWSPDGKALVSGGFRRILVWDPAVWESVATLEEGIRGRVTSLAFVGRKLVSADSVPGLPGNLQVWSLDDWAIEETIEAHKDSIFDIAVSPDRQRVATVSADKQVRLWDASTWKPGPVLEAHTGYVLTAEFSPQGDRLATAGDDEMIKVWDLETKKQIHSFTDRLATLAVNDLIWSVDPTKKPAEPKEGDVAKPLDWIVAVTEDGKPRAYTEFVVHDGTQRSGGARARAWTESDASLTSLVWLPQLGKVIAGGATGALEIWDQTGKPQGAIALD